MRHLLLCVLGALRHPRIATLGVREFRSDVGMTYDDDTDSPRSRAYDSGRELAHVATLRRFDWPRYEDA